MDWSEAFQQYSVFSPTDGTRATFTVYLQRKKRAVKPVARMLTFGEDTDDIPAIFSASSPIDSGKKVIRRKRAPRATAPLVDTSVRRSTRSSAKRDGHRHVALIDKSAPVSKKKKVQRRLKQRDCTEDTPKSPEGRNSSRTGSSGKANDESTYCSLPPTPIHVLQQIGLSLGIDPKDLTKEKLMAAPEKDSDSQSSADV
jgi:hypothetical protein